MPFVVEGFTTFALGLPFSLLHELQHIEKNTPNAKNTPSITNKFLFMDFLLFPPAPHGTP